MSVTCNDSPIGWTVRSHKADIGLKADDKKGQIDRWFSRKCRRQLTDKKCRKETKDVQSHANFSVCLC